MFWLILGGAALLTGAMDKLVEKKRSLVCKHCQANTALGSVCCPKCGSRDLITWDDHLEATGAKNKTDARWQQAADDLRRLLVVRYCSQCKSAEPPENLFCPKCAKRTVTPPPEEEIFDCIRRHYPDIIQTTDDFHQLQNIEPMPGIGRRIAQAGANWIVKKITD